MKNLTKTVLSITAAGLSLAVGCRKPSQLEGIQSQIRYKSHTNAVLVVINPDMGTGYNVKKLEREDVYIKSPLEGARKIGEITSLRDGCKETIPITRAEYRGETHDLMIFDGYTGEKKFHEGIFIPEHSKVLTEIFKKHLEEIREERRERPLVDPDLSCPTEGSFEKGNQWFYAENLSHLTGSDTNRLNKAWGNFLKVQGIHN